MDKHAIVPNEYGECKCGDPDDSPCHITANPFGICQACHKAEATENGLLRIESMSRNNVVSLCDDCKNYVNWVLTQFLKHGVRYDERISNSESGDS